MVKRKDTVIPDAWTNTAHQEVVGYGIGDGFVLFAEPGDSVRGVLRTFFPTKHGDAVALEVTEEPNALVYKTEDDGTRSAIIIDRGTLLNVSLSGVDLKRKLGAGLLDKEVGIQYAEAVNTKSGAMKVFRVVVFESDLPL